MPVLVLSHHKLQMILARRQAKARRILNILLPRLLLLVHSQLHRLAHMPNRPLRLINHFANHIQRSLIPIPALHKRYLRPRNDQRNRHIEPIFIQPEIIRIEIQRNIRRR